MSEGRQCSACGAYGHNAGGCPDPLDVNGLPPGVGGFITDAVMELRRERVLDPNNMPEASAVLIKLAQRILSRGVKR